MKISSSFRIAVDPRIELLSILQRLSKPGFTTRYAVAYAREVDSLFRPFKDHEAVKWCAASFSTGFSFDAPVNVFLHLSQPPMLRLMLPLDDEILRRAGGIEKINEMTALLNRFVAESPFMNFWQSHQEYYRTVLQSIADSLSSFDPIPLISGLFGKGRNSFVFISSPLALHGGYAVTLATGQKQTAYFIGGPHGVREGAPVFTSRDLASILFHEFGHSYINPLAKTHAPLVSQYSHMHQYMKRPMRWQYYNEWETVLNEHLVRTCELYLLEQAGFRSHAQKLHNIYYSDKKFLILPFFREKLEDYTAKRSVYRDIGSFYPEWLKVMDEITAVVTGQIPAAMGFMMDINPARTIIKSVDEDSPFRNTGMAQGDTLALFNGTEVNGNTYFTVFSLWDDAKPGDSLQVTLRNNQVKEFTIPVAFENVYTLEWKK